VSALRDVADAGWRGWGSWDRWRVSRVVRGSLYALDVYPSLHSAHSKPLLLWCDLSKCQAPAPTTTCEHTQRWKADGSCIHSNGSIIMFPNVDALGKYSSRARAARARALQPPRLNGRTMDGMTWHCTHTRCTLGERPSSSSMWYHLNCKCKVTHTRRAQVTYSR
jgi:hypothetical protein